MRRDRIATGCLLLLLTAALGPPDAGARTSAMRYRLTAEMRAKDVYTTFDEPAGVPDGSSEQRATYRATTRRPFLIRRVSSRSGTRFSFRAALTGSFTWQGGGTIMGMTRPHCDVRWTEEVWPAKRRVSGTVRLEPTGRGRIGIFITPDATGQVGVVRWDPDINCLTVVRPFYDSSLVLLVIPEQLTDPVDLRGRFGRDFTVFYEPGAISDRPNRVSPTTKTEFDFRWELRFRRVR